MPCDRCGEPVPANNSTLVVMMRAARNAGSTLGVMYFASAQTDRHLLPTHNCPGSPSRAQYLPGQPRDNRGYNYYPQIEPIIRQAYQEITQENP